ncbi:hypothetical protein [Haloferula sargassicola]|uniref:Uncharacterized protein n=1 Tax=Haloferula sargassicola TaxID=490096 RepID=A0ABP9UI89_9BACT
MEETKRMRSSDTFEDILQIDPVAEYGRLALWMVDASAEEIAGYWQHYRQQENRSNDINDLIFINWTRLDPEMAIAASAGTPDEHYAWWAWACHEPQKAFAEVQARNPDRLSNVAWGLGEFHGKWLMEHFDEIPESAQAMALRGLTKWDDVADPGAVLDFLEKTGNGTNLAIYKTLIIRDPWAAYDRLQAKNGKVMGQYGEAYVATQNFIQTMGQVHPDLLVRMAEITPTGELKRKLEDRVFRNTLATDPEAAISQALETKAPRVAANRLIKVARSLLRDDPQRALEMAQRLYALGPEAVMNTTRIERENGASTSYESGQEYTALVSGLIAVDPAQTMELVIGSAGEDGVESHCVDTVAKTWAMQDLEAYSGWVASLDEGAAGKQAVVSTLINELSRMKMYPEMMAWVASRPDAQHQLRWRIRDWWSSNPVEAREWVETADLPDQTRQGILKQFDAHEN